MSSLRQATFDIVEKLRSAKSAAQICGELKNCRQYFGYDVFVIGYLPRFSQQTLRDCVRISGWPEEWLTRYDEQGYIQIDPVIRHMRSVVDPFSWQEAAQVAGSPEGRVVIDEARTFRLNAGFSVPFHEIDGSEAGISFGGDRLRLSYEEQAALHLIAIYALSAARALFPRAGKPPGAADTADSLTAREIECLKWSAAGKTAWEISVILSISRRTVEHHLSSAGTKLRTVSRVQCCAEALRQGIIT